jgi:isopenicillin N synthase-like dioxygenase
MVDVPEIPVVDVSPLTTGAGPRDGVASAIDAACRAHGFFYVVGHGIDVALQSDLERLAREFFALDDAEKARVGMDRGGAAWRGWFPVGGELTSGVPDRKEGLYFGVHEPGSTAPLHGPNLYPARPAGLRAAVDAYMDALTCLGHDLCRGLSLALGLDERWLAETVTDRPTVLFRIFSYPPGEGHDGWGVGEHTDYGLLTILRQDDSGGLEVRTPAGWVDAPPVPGSLVCNLGDMLERMTGGRYRSTPHRVRNAGAATRLSFPFFFDPAWDARIPRVPGAVAVDRWDGADVHAFDGTYGDYLLAKVANVFPGLGRRVL